MPPPRPSRAIYAPADGVMRSPGETVTSNANIGHVIVDRHVAQGRGDKIAIRFLSRNDAADQTGEAFTYARLAADSNRFANVIDSPTHLAAVQLDDPEQAHIVIRDARDVNGSRVGVRQPVDADVRP